MAKMNFGLENVLTYRKEVEKARKLDFASAQEAYDHALMLLNTEESHVNSLNSEFLDRQRIGISAMELELYSVYFSRKITDIKQHRQEAVSLNKKVSEKRDTLVEASKEKKALEILKQKQTDLFMQDLQHKERVFLEEIALRKKGNKQ